jgi:hypothetical protein
VSSFFTLSLLEESPSLKKLELNLHPKGYKSSMDFEHGDSVTWEGLRGKIPVILLGLCDAKLTNITRQEEVLKYLKLSRCQRLRISDPGSNIIPLLSGCLEGSTTTLEQLDLRDLHVGDLGLLKFLQAFPRIRSLTLYRLGPFAGTIFEDPLCYENCSVLPTLQSLEIAGNWRCFDTETLVRFIRAKGRSLRGKDAQEGGGFEYVDGTLKWALFQDWLYPELFVHSTGRWSFCVL